jgi:hypothetical protein
MYSPYTGLWNNNVLIPPARPLPDIRKSALKTSFLLLMSPVKEIYVMIISSKYQYQFIFLRRGVIDRRQSGRLYNNDEMMISERIIR